MTVLAFMDIIPVLVQYATVLLSSYYFFSITGMLAFGGRLVPTNPGVAASSYGDSDFYSMNFNSLGEALACLLYLLVNNDWPIVMEGAVAAVGKGARVYFFAFWVVNSVLVLNVIVAFVIESFSLQKLKRELALAAQKKSGSQHTLGGKLGAAYSAGVEDWRDLIINSGLDFSEWKMTRKAHHFDIYDELYKEQVVESFSDTFNTARRRVVNPSSY